ncbi:protein-L-isoaspartate(D-aspartate) O-methyltransferase [Thalassoroseus pseudoceratinae]|uniref:protein-L-isoaspartate(D-aspartate) O-methyltransferase n=1 Tax=Thalassoroseus pseudoceratinae TaxID=2713176 RepID=UPI0014242335|nr:protein-L-isoaspartate(D-aspartate) O-methyltransferase [Thalassoroseus pseudoceratinae]
MIHRTQFRLVFGGLLVLLCLSEAAQPQDRFEEARKQMVQRWLRDEGISNRRVLQAMTKVPRHEFVTRTHQRSAYTDQALPIGHRQTISPPFIVGYMTESIDPQPTDKVLEIGTGSGYQAAVLGELADEVYTIEIVKPLGESAARRLKALDYENVHVKVGDGYQGWPEHAPFDKIIVTCSPEKVPIPLVQQLREGGTMIIPLGERYQQVFHLLKKKDGKLEQERLIPTLFVPMTGISENNREKLPDPKNPELVNGSFEHDDNDDGRADGWHYQRQTTLETRHAPHGKRCVTFENEEPGRLAQMLQGMAIDGREIARLRFRMAIRMENVRRGRQRFQQPGLVMHFYDDIRRPVGEISIGPWLGSQDWEVYSQTIVVPPRTREAVIRMGLNGGTGTLSIDNIQMELARRQ